MIWTYEVNIFAIDETIIKNGLEEILHADLDWKKKGDCVLRVCACLLAVYSAMSISNSPTYH